jgi:hypothetical protein
MSTVERLDPLEPGENSARFLHVADGSGRNVSARAQLCDAFATGAQPE